MTLGGFPGGIYGGIGQLGAARKTAASAVKRWDYTGIVAAWEAKGAADLAASYVNLANPGTYDLTADSGKAPTHTVDDGWGYNGVDQFLRTGLTPGANWSVVARFSEASGTSHRAVFGADSYSARRFYLWPIIGGWGHGFGAGGYTFVSTYIYGGAMGLLGRQGWLNGASDGSQTNAAYADVPQFSPLIGAMAGPPAGAATFFWNGKIQAVYVYDHTFTQMTEVMAAIMDDSLPWGSGGAASNPLSPAFMSPYNWRTA